MKSNTRLLILGVPVVVLIAALGLAATTASFSIGTPTELPSVISVSQASTVTITVPIPDPLLIPGSVNVLRLGLANTQPTILGTMHDDGKNGDAVAGDGIYTLRFSLTEASPGQIRLQISAAFRGVLQRVTTAPAVVIASADGTAPLPPDPGTPGMATLSGIDSDS